MNSKLNVRLFVSRVTELAKARMREQRVVSLDDVKKANQKIKPTLLLIEDDETIRLSLVRYFSKFNYMVIPAASALELTSVLKDSVFDIVILDVGLPWVDGFEIANLLKENKSAASIPIIFLSGSDDIESIKKGFQSGAHDFITKPFELEHLRKTVEVLLTLSGSNN